MMVRAPRRLSRTRKTSYCIVSAMSFWRVNGTHRHREASMGHGFYSAVTRWALAIGFVYGAALSPAAPAALAPTANFGPYNVNFLEGSVGLTRPLSADTAILAAGAPWSIAGWVRITRRQFGEVI